MSLGLPKSSYNDIPPLEIGGVVARKGFYFQDHVAAGFCIDMLTIGSKLKAVWCEALDDVTLVHDDRAGERFEFVQVKNNEAIASWSISRLCKREKKKGVSAIGSSILEKSLAYERGAEQCSFRIVTCLRIKAELKLLELPLSSPKRTSVCTEFTELCKKVNDKVPGCESPNGSNVSSWLSRTVWEVGHATEALKNRNLLNLRKALSALGFGLAEDQWDELYIKVLYKVQEAGRSDWEVDPGQKKIIQDSFLHWIKDEINKSLHPSIDGAGAKLAEKMTIAEIPFELIENARNQRRNYRTICLSNRYMDLSRRNQLESDTAAHLNLLLSQLDAGKLDDSGIEFHTRCLEKLAAIQSSSSEISLSFFQGYMYHITDRCVYRFTTKVAL